MGGDLLSALEGPNSVRETAEIVADDRKSSRGTDSLFFQILDRIVKGRKIEFGADGDGETSLDILIENSSIALVAITLEGGIVKANPVFCATFGYSEAELADTSILELLTAGYRTSFLEALRRLEKEESIESGASEILALRGLRRDGKQLSMDCRFALVENGKVPRVLAVIHNLSANREIVEELQQSKDEYVALTETITEAILRIDSDFKIVFANSGVKQTFGYDREELVGGTLVRLFPEEVFRRHENDFRKYFYVDDQDRLKVGLKPTIELLGLTKHRGLAPMEISFGNSKDLRGRTLTCIIREISQRKTTERRLRHLAFHDTLTGLGNRDLFTQDMKSALEECQREGAIKAALLLMDLDGFKHVNDTYGHPAGDELLIQTAKNIRDCLRDSDSAYRLGGDEFVILLPKVGDVKDIAIVGERILGAVHQPYVLNSGSPNVARIDVGVSVGAALLPDHGRTTEEATRSADIAMYCSKEAGKNLLTVYDESLSTRATSDWRLEQEMRQALVKGEFEMNYQPLVDRQCRIVGLEALIRWKRDGQVHLRPSEFISKAESNGIIVPLGTWVLRSALADLRRLDAAGFHKLDISINVSGMQLEQADFLEGLTVAVLESGLESSRIKLEITETTLFGDREGADSRIRAIKERFPEMMLVIDDFGTGYSSLSYLARFPVDFLKIDISFVRSLADGQNRKVVNAILNLAESLDIQVVAEGIENARQFAYFRERRCRRMQGFYFMEALPIGELERQLIGLRDRTIAVAVPAPGHIPVSATRSPQSGASDRA